jgi:cellulose synthase/poly-beta-1,6-N-acetylglucosamine synthase-like glycosyltransferase
MKRDLTAAGGVSVVTCTNRPQFFDNIIVNFNAQRYPVKELIIVLNKDSMDLNSYRLKISKYTNVQIYKAAERMSLGHCLNLAVSKSKYPFIAKFDDDDYYSPYYLGQQMRAIQSSGADIVGKRTSFVYLEDRKTLIMRYPGKSNRFCGLVAGATLLFRRTVFIRVKFANISLGEDVAFLRRCRRAGFKVYATSPLHFAAIRRKNKMTHTWRAADRKLLSGSRIVVRTTNFRKFVLGKAQ